ncbi:MAG: single-stranded-DNA-specific exonuclease RecJ [Chloroflexi bacterium RBG_16_51_9]|nr:MAG: single-stranded-DNA-specific exonuclease RecJ [Chloroflexi bacterium RBG_16_51_9]
MPPVPHREAGGVSALDSAGSLQVSPLVAQLLYNRGLTDPSQIASFLAADESLSGDPNLLPDMHLAVARLYRALLSNENIAIYGDFDADGITATALLVQGLSLLDCKATPYIPHRVNEGYGLNTTALETLKQQGINLVVTVDCGVTASAEVKAAKKMGLDVIITDHHTPSNEIPPAIAVVNPKLPGSKYPFSELAGVGVALKLLQALFGGMGKEKLLGELADLVALGTIADMVPLLGENRYLVKRGLELLSASPRLGIRELMTQSGSNTAHLDTESVSWTIAPRLNAAGRLEHAMGSYRLLMTDSPDEARDLAKWLEQKNAERQRLTASTMAKAREQVLAQGDSPVLIASDADYPAGIMGLVAGRLSEEFYRPVIVLRTSEQLSGGSCRSIPEFDIIQALNRCQHLLTHFGGHSRAAGLSLRTSDLPRLHEKLLEIAAAELAGIDLRPRVDIDAEVTLTGMGGNTFETIQKLAPFGQGNPAPTFLSRRVNIVDCRTMGNTGDHLRLKLKQDSTHSTGSGQALWDGVGFNLGCYRGEISSLIDIVYNLEIDHWNGQEKLRLNILDFEPSR